MGFYKNGTWEEHERLDKIMKDKFGSALRCIYGYGSIPYKKIRQMVVKCVEENKDTLEKQMDEYAKKHTDYLNMLAMGVEY